MKNICFYLGRESVANNAIGGTHIVAMKDYKSTEMSTTLMIFKLTQCELWHIDVSNVRIQRPKLVMRL